MTVGLYVNICSVRFFVRGHSEHLTLLQCSIWMLYDLIQYFFNLDLDTFCSGSKACRCSGSSISMALDALMAGTRTWFAVFMGIYGQDVLHWPWSGYAQ